MSNSALTLPPQVVVGIESQRLNRYFDGSLHCLAMGRMAAEVEQVHSRMIQTCRAGDPSWFDVSQASRYFRRQGHEIYLHDALYYDSTPRILDDDLRISFRDHGRAFHVPVGAELLAWFGQILPRLRRTVPMQRVREICDDDAWSFVQQLEAAGLIEEVPLARLEPLDGFSMRSIGHAALALETPTTRVLFDPMLVVRTRPDHHLLHELERPVDAIVISHPHWDHFNVDTLLHVPRETPMVIPRLTHPASIENVDMGALLRELGFVDIRELDPWQQITIGDAEVAAVPFHGEQAGPESKRDWMTYHVRAGGRAFFGAVDTCHDDHRTMDAVLRQMRARLGEVDILCSPFSDFHYPTTPFNRRPFYLGPGMDKYTGGPDDAARWCSILGAQVLVPYAAFVFNEADLRQPPQDCRRGSLDRLRSLVRSPPHGPLVVLEAGGEGISWSGPGAELRLPTSQEPRLAHG